MYKKVNREVLAKIKNTVGEKNMIVDQEMMANYSHDEFSLSDITREPEVVVKPRTTEEVAQIMKLASREMIPVTPRGGATGLCGGCVPSEGGIVLSLENMNRVVEIDEDNQMAVVEAGVTLRDFSRAVEEAGFLFPPHPGEESAMIGGLIATNAGGSRAVKYGVMRTYVRGVELVLASGEILTIGGKLMKCSTGYNLLNLVIGSEGTLGIITKAVISFLPPSQVIRTLIIPYNTLEEAIDTVPFLSRKKILPMAVEFIEREVIQISERHLNRKWPCVAGKTFLLIILDASGPEEMDRLSGAVAEVCLEKGALDVYVADTPSKQENVLEIRSKVYEAIKAQTIEILDIVVPRAEIPAHVKRIRETSEKYGIWLPTFGHAADGNVHTHIMKARLVEGSIQPCEEAEWRPKVDLVRRDLYQDCQRRGGAISGEHGIGLVKKPYLSANLGEKQVALMRGIKKVFDPQNILNPHKIFD